MSPTGVRLRPMRWWDVGRIAPLEHELFGPTAWAQEMFWSELSHPQTRWYVVAEPDPSTMMDGSAPVDDPDTVDAVGPGGGPVPILGYAGLLAPGAEADVQTIAVAPSAQRHGVGRLLLEALIGTALARGATTLLLEVRADNGPAIQLYRSRGFERIAIRRRYYQPGDIDAWVMRLRPLTATP